MEKLFDIGRLLKSEKIWKRSLEIVYFVLFKVS